MELLCVCELFLRCRWRFLYNYVICIIIRNMAWVRRRMAGRERDLVRANEKERNWASHYCIQFIHIEESYSCQIVYIFLCCNSLRRMLLFFFLAKVLLLLAPAYTVPTIIANITTTISYMQTLWWGNAEAKWISTHCYYKKAMEFILPRFFSVPAFAFANNKCHHCWHCVPSALVSGSMANIDK